eukprot:gene10102-2267_t
MYAVNLRGTSPLEWCLERLQEAGDDSPTVVLTPSSWMKAQVLGSCDTLALTEISLAEQPYGAPVGTEAAMAVGDMTTAS